VHSIRPVAVALLACACSLPGSAAEPTLPTDSPSAVTTTTIEPVVVPATTTTVPALEFTATIEEVTAADLGDSWREGCPVGPEELRQLRLIHHTFDGGAAEGLLVVHREVAQAVVEAFEAIFAGGFPIAAMEPVHVHGSDDGRSMDANNTSAFNCRTVTGGTRWSEHAHGTAIDINPVQNPYVRGSTVLPAAGQGRLGRDAVVPGMIIAGDAVTTAFAAIGWQWGGTWPDPDYQHFSASGR
jgi:hypothetical protein